MSSPAIVIAPIEGAGSGEVVYESPTTRIVRFKEAAGALIWKEYSGFNAAQRLRHEREILARLAGVKGVVQLAQTQQQEHGQEHLALYDAGASTLAQVLQAGPCSISAVLLLAHQLAGTLAQVHRAGVIHRDINPTNILVTAAHQPVLIDFDLAALSSQEVAMEPDEDVVVTLGYMAPEQSGRTGHAVDRRADLYSLGAVFYEMTTGRPPFEQADALQLIHDHLVREPIAPWEVDARVPRGLSNIIVRLLAKAPDQRFQSAEGLQHDLHRLRIELEQGRSDVFDLGEQDFPARLAAPSRLVGRHAELATLQSTFADAVSTQQRTVLIGGPAGSGKSALINELRPAVALAGGWFIYGKFDQYHKDGSSNGALTQALRALGRLLLTQSGDEVIAQRQRILHSVGPNAALITQASPEFALLLGTQADAQLVDPRQAELQLQQAMLELLAAIATPSCPLVVVVDDLQWAGADSLRLFERMMVDLELPGLLLVGCYRFEEVDAGPVLGPMLARWQDQVQPPLQIALSNLTLDGLSQMTRHMLRLAPQPGLELATALNALTRGNPFDTVEMINALRSEGLLSLGESGWQWDDAKIRRFIGHGNVVDLLAARISRLPAPSRELLEFMSCLSSTVECKLLCAAMGLADAELQVRLRAPLEDGLLVAHEENGQDGVAFRHDRVQQAMLGAMDDAQRGQRQLAMARRLANEPDHESQAAQQYLACVGMLTEPDERLRAVHLFHRLAQALASRATFMLAERYLTAASELLEAIGEPQDAALRRTIDVARHRALFSMGRMDEAEPLYTRIEEATQDPVDMVEPATLQIRLLSVNGRPQESLALGVRRLTQLGLHVPPGFNDPLLEQRLNDLPERIRQQIQLDQGRQPQVQDPRMLGIYKLLDRLLTSAYYGNDRKAVTWLLLEAQRHWAEYGPCDELMGCLGNVGIVLDQRGDHRNGYMITRHVIAMGEDFGFEVRTAGVRFMFSWRQCPWFEPLENALEHATRASEVSRAKGGDPAFACYFNIAVYLHLFDIAPELETCEAQTETGLVSCKRAGNPHAGAFHTMEQQFLRSLRGLTKGPYSLDDDGFNEEEFMARSERLPSTAPVLSYYRAFQSLLRGDTVQLLRYAPAALDSFAAHNGHYRTMHGYLFVGLSRAWQMQRGDACTDEQLAEMESARKWMHGRAADQPHNFLHLLRLMEAEEAWARGDLWKAAVTFDAAVVEAGARQRPWHRAFITERAGLFNLAQGLTGAGRDLLARARDHYQAWGARAKVDLMEGEHAFLRPAHASHPQPGGNVTGSIKSSGTVSPEALDLIGVLRASQALSSETSLERLSARVSEVLASLSGATKVLVLSRSEGQWWLLSHASGLPSMPVAQAAEAGLLPLSAFTYAERTGEALIVDDAVADDRFTRDRYFAGVPVCSLLLAPITSQGAALGMLLLENRLGRAAFNARRLDAVMLIAGQLAVSLANAQLYESLEQRVQARTRELQETQARLVTTARSAGRAEVATNVLHNVGNVLNSINVSAKVMRRNIGKSRIEGLTQAVALINEHEHDLPRFIETDPRGKALWPYLNQLVGVLQTERDEIVRDLDRLSLSVDHITYVVATQQSHAGPSSVLELARPEDLVEEALYLSADVIKRCEIEVRRHYEEVPVSALDKQRLVQILVNLIGNAAQAMESLPVPARQLKLQVGLTQGEDSEGGQRLRITVQDAGVGIAPENITRIFSHGFTTRKSGHGFGLHSSALAATEMGGKLTVHSDGPGRGAVFTFELPLKL
jgi:predicted ATPase/signal transduction histidine kinase